MSPLPAPSPARTAPSPNLPPNRTEGGPPYEDVVTLFGRQVRADPGRLAVSAADGDLTFAELDARANALADRLRAAGVTAESRVALCLRRGVGPVVAILAVWKAGGAYVPLDPSYPPARIEAILDDCRPDVVLTDPGGLRTSHPTLVLDDGHDARDAGPTPPAEAPEPGDAGRLAYIIYTSGSTGSPKGVQIERGALAHLARGHQRHLFPFLDALGDRPARSALTAAFSFDASLNQMLWLLRGDSLWIVDDETRRDAVALVEYVRRNRIDVIDVTPTLLTVLMELGLFEGHDSRPALAIVAGEATGPVLWKALRALPGTRFLNLYGPTEATVYATAQPLGSAGDVPSIGRPVVDTLAYVVDAAGRRVPDGSDGELWLGGPGVARGYWNRAGLTAKHFLDDPFRGRGWVYRTGDRVRRLPDGELEFLGRMDDQVKIRGFRVEPGEVADVLARHPLVGQASVVARTDTTGSTRLVAYVAPAIAAERHSSADTAEAVPLPDLLKTHAAELLPEHMRPSLILELPRLPLNHHGKLDREALPDPYRTAADQPAGPPSGPPPRTATEGIVAALWAGNLGLPGVSRHDNYFDLGGDSLTVVRMITQVTGRFGVKVSLRDVLGAADLAAFCALIDRAPRAEADH
ncbi:non-ribosomal peptide synthetase [Streptomyces sp. CS227]|uniref:non-ribosomal peptide synthetase n=1 Tax=Streptomyces sp. CS227 TaxID=1982763 RepID=UPI0015C62F32|nr:non-ribosomal peptide synthetase [Streptomyces sp. CS227]